MKKWYKPRLSNLNLEDTKHPATSFDPQCEFYCTVCGGCKHPILVNSCSYQNDKRIPACSCGSSVTPS